MGVVYTRQLPAGIVTGLWEITESEEELFQSLRLREKELALYRSFRTESRRKQWLAYRVLIQSMMSPASHDIEYDEAGKPYLANSHYHISVTHTENMAGAIISPEVHVGIDMEMLKERIIKVKEKFMSEEELARVSPSEPVWHLTMAWCAKESAYKLCGKRQTDFREHIRVRLPEKADSGRFHASVKNCEITGKIELFYDHFREFLLVCAWLEPENRLVS